MPQKCAGMRSEPLMSLPRSSGDRPAATAAAPPPELPPGVRSRFHGLFVRPKIGLTDCPPAASGGKLVLPRMIAPACRSSATAAASRCGT